jgi:hypothetical protein
VRASLAFVFLALALSVGCGPQRPPRYVIESDLAGYHYRRYQKVLDIELPVPENPAVGHVATYVRGSEPLGARAKSGGEPPQIVPVFVTAYARAQGLSESVRQHLRSMSEYTLEVRKIGGENVWHMRGESGDVWLVWVSGRQLVKVGAPDGFPRVPEGVAEAYLDHYPSDLNRKGKVKRGAESAGPAVALSDAAPSDELTD